MTKVRLYWNRVRLPYAKDPMWWCYYRGLKIEVSALDHNAFAETHWTITVCQAGTSKGLLFKVPVSDAKQGKTLAPKIILALIDGLEKK